MPRFLVWDLPIRLIHWMLAAGLLGAFAIAKFGGDDGPLFNYHSIIGITLLALLLLRLVWGVIGSRPARFASLPLSLRSLASYLRDLPAAIGKRFSAHNPATAWASLAMFGLLAIVGVSGVMNAQGFEPAEEVHELAVYALLAVVGVHVAGVVLHTFHRRENLTLGMIDGRKAVESTDSIPSAHPIAASAMLVVVAVLGLTLVRNYDAAAARTSLAGITLQLGEAEGNERVDAERGHQAGDDD